MKKNNILHRLLSLSVSLLLILSMFSAVPVSATGTTEVTFGEAIAKAGEEVIIPISIKNNLGIASFRFRVYYDTDIFEFISATEGPLLTIGKLSSTTSTTSETLTFQWFSEKSIYGDGNLVELKFKVLKSRGGEHPLNVSYLKNDIINEDLETIPFSVTTGKILVLCNDLEHQFSLNGENTCHICKYSKKPTAPVIDSKTNNSITLVATSGFEYSINGVDWQDDSTFLNLTPGTTYTFYQRVKASDLAFESEKSEGLTVLFKSVPTSLPPKPEVLDCTDTSITLKEVDGCEYSKDGTNWQESNVFSGLSCGTEYTFYQRYKETDTTYTGSTSTVLFAMTNKGTQMAPAGPIFSGFTDTTVTLVPIINGEYSKDGIVWQKSNVFSGLVPGTDYTFYQRYAETSSHKASDSSNGNNITTDKSKQTLIPSAPTVQSFTESSITLYIIEGCEYSMDGKVWQSSNIFTGLSCATEYTFYQRFAETDTTYVGSSSGALITKTDKGKQSDPVAPILFEKTHNSVTLVKVSGYEYSKDGINWQESNVFVDLSLGTNYIFYQRKAETSTHYASEISERLIVKTNETPPYILGDLDCDGMVTTADLAMMKLYLAGIGELPEYGVLGADLNSNGRIDTTDLAVLKLKLAGLE